MKLQHYQESVLDKGGRPFAVHGTGTGKTLTSLKFIEESQRQDPDRPIVLVTSAALKDNLAKEHEKHGIPVDLSKVTTVTHESMSRPASSKVIRDSIHGGTLILDEIHKIRNPKSKGYANVMEASRNADRVLGLTGTAIVNDIDDMGHLYDLVKGAKGTAIRDNYTKLVPEKLGFFDRLRGRTPKVKFQVHNPRGLKDRFSDIDIYYPPENDPNRPVVTERVEEVVMPEVQQVAYSRAENESIKGKPELEAMATKIRNGEQLTKSEMAKANAFASQTSQAAISSAKHVPGTQVSGKMDKAVSDLLKNMEENKDHRGILYANKIDAGINPLIDRLAKKGLSDKVQVITGATNKSDVKDIVKNYNDGSKPLLLASDAAAEGLDLKGTRSIQVLTPFFNDGKIKQVIGRGARFGSHAHLPKEERRVDVTHYHSTFPEKWLSKTPQSVDQWMHGLAKSKASEREMVISVLS